MPEISDELLSILACPKCKSKVALKRGRIVCEGTGCGLQFPIRDGIPVMLIEEAAKPDASN